MNVIFQNKIFVMAVLVTIIASLGILRYPDEIDKFVGLISTVWGTFVGATLDMSKDKQ